MPPGAPPQGSSPYGPPPAGFLPGAGPRTSGLAIASLVTGLLSLPFWFCCCAGSYWGAPFAIAALATGILAMGKIRQNPQMVRGGGLAIAGMILGGVGLVMAFLAIFTSIDESIRQRYSPAPSPSASP